MNIMGVMGDTKELENVRRTKITVSLPSNVVERLRNVRKTIGVPISTQVDKILEQYYHDEPK